VTVYDNKRFENVTFKELGPLFSSRPKRNPSFAQT